MVKAQDVSYLIGTGRALFCYTFREMLELSLRTGTTVGAHHRGAEVEGLLHVKGH